MYVGLAQDLGHFCLQQGPVEEPGWGSGEKPICSWHTIYIKYRTFISLNTCVILLIMHFHKRRLFKNDRRGEISPLPLPSLLPCLPSSCHSSPPVSSLFPLPCLLSFPCALFTTPFPPVFPLSLFPSLKSS